MEVFQRSKYSRRNLFKLCTRPNPSYPPIQSLYSRHLSLCGWVGKELAGMVALSQAAGRAVSQHCHLPKDSVVFSKLSFADPSPCAPPLPVVSPTSVSIPGDSTGTGQAAPPLWLNQHWRLWTKRADWALWPQPLPGDTHLQNEPRKAILLGHPDSSQQKVRTGLNQ